MERQLLPTTTTATFTATITTIGVGTSTINATIRTNTGSASSSIDNAGSNDNNEESRNVSNDGDVDDDDEDQDDWNEQNDFNWDLNNDDHNDNIDNVVVSTSLPQQQRQQRHHRWTIIPVEDVPDNGNNTNVTMASDLIDIVRDTEEDTNNDDNDYVIVDRDGVRHTKEKNKPSNRNSRITTIHKDRNNLRRDWSQSTDNNDNEGSSPPSCPRRINPRGTPDPPPIDSVTYSVPRNVHGNYQEQQQQQHQQQIQQGQFRLPNDPFSRSSCCIENVDRPSYKDQLQGDPSRRRKSAPASSAVSDVTMSSICNDNGTEESTAVAERTLLRQRQSDIAGIVTGGGGVEEYKRQEMIDDDDDDDDYNGRRVVEQDDNMMTPQHATFIGLADAESTRRISYADAIIAPCIVYDNNGNCVCNCNNNRYAEIQQQRRQPVSTLNNNNSSGGINTSNELIFLGSPSLPLSSDVVPTIERPIQNVSYDVRYDNNGIVGTTIPPTRLRESIASSSTAAGGGVAASTRSSLLGLQYLRDTLRSTIINSTTTTNSSNNNMTPNRINELEQKCFPFGLCQQLQTTKATFPIRFWIIDNSGSMLSNDGHRCVIQPAGSHYRNKQEPSCMQVPCTRWKELQSTLEFHTWIAGKFEVPTVFRLLNDPRIGPQEFIVSNMDELIQGDAVLSQVHPEGISQLTTHLCVIHDHIASVQSLLHEQRQKAVVIVATDGLPTDRFGKSDDVAKRDFINALTKFQLLPEWIVIRLCTDDESVLKFYRSLDDDLELGMEVLDDYINEAKKIHQTNYWLNYSASFQRCREMGCDKRIYDILNERLLTRDELHDFFAILFGYDVVNAPTAPNIHMSSWKEFSHFIKTLVEAEAKQWNPISKRMEYIVDMKKLNRCYNQHHSISINAGKLLGSLFH